MGALLPRRLDEYVGRHATPEDPVLSALAEETRASTDQPQMMVGNTEGILLRAFVRAIGARRVLEVGTFTGYSALSMAMGLPEDGRVVTCDTSEAYTAIARRFWERSPHGEKITLHLGPALETLSSLAGPFDLAFIDADKTNYVRYWEAILPLLRPRGLVVADNVLWSGRVIEPAPGHDEDTAALAAFNEHVRRDDRVEHVMLGVRDGVTIAVKL